jgi:predicted RNase H-like HicB family nuclease
MRYAVVIEKAGKNFSGYVPDLPGCIATGTTVEETENELQSAIHFHLEGMLLNGETIPVPQSVVEYMFISAQHCAPGDAPLQEACP